MTSQKGMSLLKVVSDYIRKTNGFDKILEKVVLVSGGDGLCRAEFKVDSTHLNGGGGLHGGFIASLVDSISTYALMTYKEEPVSGVSVDIHVSYLKGAREGDDIVVDARTIRAGKTLAFLEVELKNKATNDIIARGTHTKYVGGSVPSGNPKNI